jgi:hypothetical protein
VILASDDRSELLQVQHLYGHVFDGRWELIDQVFAADGVLDASESGLPVVKGYEAIREHVTSLHTGLITNHTASNAAVLEVTADGVVKMISKFIVGVEVADSGRTYLRSGIYEDDCVATPDGWRIAKRYIRQVVSVYSADGK